MKFDFDLPTDRRGTPSLKWSVAEGELPMWVADMDFETAPAVKREILKTAEHGIFGYSITPDSYFDSVAEFFNKRYNMGASSDEMVFVTGVVPAISSMVRKLTTPAENVLIQAPVYNIFYNSIRNNGRNILSSDLVYEDGKYYMDFEDLERKLCDPQTTLMILCNPHNPVGRIWTREELMRVGELCKKHGVTVISDEIHAPLTRPGTAYIPFSSVSETCREISAVCVSASKSFNLAGLQSACVIAHNKHLRHKIWRGINTDEVGEPNIFAMNASIAAYREGEEWLDSLRDYLFENRRVAEEYIRANTNKLIPIEADATYLMWVDISGASADSVDFAEKLRKETGLFINDGAEYGECARSFIRVNLATQRENVLLGMKLLCDFANSL